MTGRHSRRDQDAENATFILESVARFEEMRASGQVAVAIELGRSGITSSVLKDVKSIAEAHHGSAPIELRWSDGSSKARLRSRSLKLAATAAALSELRAVLGDEHVRLVKGGTGAARRPGGPGGPGNGGNSGGRGSGARRGRD